MGTAEKAWDGDAFYAGLPAVLQSGLPMFLVYGTWDPLRWPLPLGHDSNRTVPSAVATVKRTGEYRLRLLF